MKTFFCFFFSLVSLVSEAQADITPKVSEALKTGNAQALAEMCAAQVELGIGGQDDTYPRDEVKALLVKFFSSNVPRSFTMRHEGTSKLNDQYRIGELVTSGGTYRVTFFIRKAGTQMLISQLKIEAPGE